MLLSSHHLSEVEQVCDHVLVMNQGQLVADGTVAELIGTPRSVYVEVDDRDRARVGAQLVAGRHGCATPRRRAGRRHARRPPLRSRCCTGRRRPPTGDDHGDPAPRRRVLGSPRDQRPRRCPQPRSDHDRSGPYRVHQGRPANADPGHHRFAGRTAHVDRCRHSRPREPGRPRRQRRRTVPVGPPKRSPRPRRRPQRHERLPPRGDRWHCSPATRSPATPRGETCATC